MAIEMKVPSVGESVSEVTIASWIKKDGDQVKMDEVICELESDKATFELPAEADGILRIVAAEGTTLPIGALICKIESTNDKQASTPAAEPAQAPKEEPKVPAAEPTPAPAASTPAPTAPAEGKTIDVVVPAVGESISEVTIASWSKKDGDSVKMDEVICELESDKATFELPSPENGVITIVAQAGQVVPIGGVVAKIAVGGASTAPAATQPAAQEEKPAAQASGNNYAAGHPSPVAAKVLAEKGIDPATVQGTGVGGRIMKEDALKATPTPAQTTVPSTPPTPAAETKAPASTPVASGVEGRITRREKMTSLRKTIARRLVAVKQETAMLTTFNEVDMKPIMDLRAKYKDKFKETHGVGLGFMSFFTKACAIALKDFPVVNAYIDGDEIVYNDYADIAIAVSAPRGLVVPVIRNAEKLSFAGIESEVVRLAGKARDNKLTIEEMTGGTFTITNGGIFGSMLSTPIINAPQSAILGMHNIVERAVVINGEIVIRPIMYVALSYDHRTIDGKDSVSFLVRVKQLLEDPARILLGV